LGKLKEADVAYTEAIRINPIRLEGYSKRGVVLVSLDQNEDKLVDFEKVIGEKPDLNEEHTCKALKYKEEIVKTQLEAAVAALDQRIKYNPKDAGAYNTKGERLMELGRFKEALAAYHEVVKLNPKHKWGYENIGFALYHSGELEESIKWYDKQVKIRDEWIIHAKKGKALCDLGNITEGMEHIQKAMNKFKKGKLKGNRFTAEDGLETYYNELEVALLREIEELLGQ
jgi:tetratricopeptide (TPR) repeat protein